MWRPKKPTPALGPAIGMRNGAWRCVGCSAAGTSNEIIRQIAQASRTAIADRVYQQFLIESGFEPDFDSTPDKFRRFIEDDIARLTPIVKAIGLRLD
jgi:tripartite-type tricarboxylate transporter receptor subunit TctC